jgi:hypothetical protein
MNTANKPLKNPQRAWDGGLLAAGLTGIIYSARNHDTMDWYES